MSWPDRLPPRQQRRPPPARPLANGLIVANGHGPEGLTAGPWSGLAVALLALGQPPVTDLAPFGPSRFHA